MTCTQRLIIESMNAQDRVEILNAVAALSSGEREVISQRTRDLVNDAMNAQDRVKLLNAVAALPSGEREAILNISWRLVHAGINADDRVRILAAIADIPSPLRVLIYVADPAALSVDERVEQLQTLAASVEAQSPPDRMEVLNAIAALPDGRRQHIFSICQRLFNQGMNVGARFRVLAAIAALPNEIWGHAHIENSEALSVDEIVEQLRTLPARVAERFSNHMHIEVVVDVDKLEENPTEVLEKLIDKYDAHKVFPDIRFQTAAGVDNEGIDAGGVSRSLVTELMRALCNPEPPNQRKLPMGETESGLVPRMEDPGQLKSYRALGMVFATAMDPARVTLTGSHFNPVLFQMIHALTREEIDQIPGNLTNFNDIPQDIQKKLLKIYLKAELPRAFGDPNISKENLELAIHDFVEHGTMNDWMSAFVESKEEFFSENKLNQILLATCVIAKSTQQCIKQPSRWDTLKGAASEELQTKVEGTLTKELVIAALKFNADDEVRRAFIIQWIQAATPKELENFVFCISGSTTLSVSRKLNVDLKALSPRLPSFHTCHYTMDLPRYDTYEIFKEKLELSIKSVMEGNLVGLA